MGKRGIGAERIVDEPDLLDTSLFGPLPTGREKPPWEAEGLSRADRVIVFLHHLEVTAGKLAGKPLELRQWQLDIIRRVYATDDDGSRPVRTAVLSFGRKNGKTALAAGLALCHLAGPEAEQRGEVYSAANDRAQAGKIFNEMVAMRDRSPWLNRRISIRRFTKELEDVKTGSVYAALSADAATKHGLSPSCVIYDELGQAATRDLYDALDTAMGARVDPLMIVISTQAATDTAPMSDLIDYGLKVNAGAVDDPSFHLELYTAPLDADPWAPETWQLANPALGDFLSLAEVKRQAEQARRMPAKEPAFRNLILNQRVASEKHFLTAGEWMACAAKPDAEALKGKLCFAGLDLSSSRDLTALVLAFPQPDGAIDVLPFFWLPGDNLLAREDDDRVPYTAWRMSGALLTTPGVTIDPSHVAAKVAELATVYDLRMIGYDRWRIEAFQKALGETGCAVELTPFGQGYKEMSPAVDLLERLIAERRLRHGGHPILNWNAGNAVADSDPAGNRKLNKARSRGRIDGMIALMMALSVAARHEEDEPWQPFYAEVDV